MFNNKLHNGCVLVIGGAKSGKSRIAMEMCEKLRRKKIFMATAQALDDEMKKRIQRHQEDRGDDWITVEEPVNIMDKILKLDNPDTVILVDCLTLWINNLFMTYGESHKRVQETINALIEEISRIKGIVIIVSNEVGMGIVPENDLARVYRDIAGSLNQRIAQLSRKVVAVIAGIPMVLKDE